jgi:hypothetical protein
MLDRVLSLANGASDRLAEAIAKALGVFEAPLVQPALFDLLRRDSREMRRAAAWSLGQVGAVEAVEAVEPLLVLARQDPFDDVKDAAQLAVRRIQGRARTGPRARGRGLTPSENAVGCARGCRPDTGGR